MIGLLGIACTRTWVGFLEARMIVDERMRQPYELLHGGASVVLAGSVGGRAILGLWARRGVKVSKSGRYAEGRPAEAILYS